MSRGVQNIEEVFECLESKKVSWIDVGDWEMSSYFVSSVGIFGFIRTFDARMLTCSFIPGEPPLCSWRMS
jgi:hypothetical protein